MVVQDSRGRFASDGDFYPCLRQMDDGYDSVQWAAHIPGSDGQGAMTGFSGVGATRLLAAVMRPPSLRAIAPAFIASRTSTDGRKRWCLSDVLRRFDGSGKISPAPPCR